LQDPVGTLAFHAPTLSPSGIALVAEEPVTKQAKEMVINKGRDVVLACFRSIASSPFSPPSHGNVYPPLDYAALDAKGIIRAVGFNQRWRSVGEVFHLALNQRI
jgi:hypothetical protein